MVPDVGETNPSVVAVMCEGVPSDSQWDFVQEQEDMNYEGTLVKPSPCPKRRMRTTLPQQSSFSSMEALGARRKEWLLQRWSST